jgi:hypothetical protein
MRINIVLVAPPDFKHREVFNEVITLFSGCLQNLGHEVLISENVFKPDWLNIIIANQFLRYTPNFQKFKYIILQLEQLGFAGGWFRQPEIDKSKFISTFLPLLQNASQVWDYSLENVDFLKTFNIEAKLIPFGFDSRLQTIEPGEKDIDVFFYGSLSERRIEIIEKLKTLCNCVNVFGVYGKERDKLIARSKIILNIHHNKSEIMQQVRIFYLLINKCFVISEDCTWNPYGDGIITVPYDQLVEQTLSWLKKDKERELIAAKGFEKIQTINSCELIKNSLADLQFSQ